MAIHRLLSGVSLERPLRRSVVAYRLALATARAEAGAALVAIVAALKVLVGWWLDVYGRPGGNCLLYYCYCYGFNIHEMHRQQKQLRTKLRRALSGRRDTRWL